MTVYEKIQSMTETELAIYLLQRDIAVIADVARQVSEQNVHINLFHSPAESIQNIITYLRHDETKL